ncbi:zinc finger protein ZFP1 [Trypanosoma cruzi]|nr:zinc finger protein [Trypanosoma cruzi]KAF8295148.1 zinc finger protein ZFP1 [Trypanosoma cruzi]
MWKSTSSKTMSDNSTTHSKTRDTNYSKFRTRVCRNYSMGITCPFGERCAFSHGEPDKSHVRTEEAELPPPPPYPEGVHAEIMLPPAYPSRFRHDPYGPEGFVVVAKELFSVDRIQRSQPLGRLYT